MPNISSSATPTCDSVYGAGFECAKAIDGATGTRWVSGSGQPHYIELEWPAQHTFQQIRFWAQGAGGEQFSEYYIEHWDGASWIEDVHVTPFSTWGEWIEHELTFTTPKIRFRTTAGNNFTGLNELECYEYVPPVKLSGTIKQKGTPVQRTVRAYTRSTGALYSSGASGEDGSFSIDAPDTTTEMFIIAFDNGEEDQFNSLIFDRVKGVQQ